MILEASKVIHSPYNIPYLSKRRVWLVVEKANLDAICYDKGVCNYSVSLTTLEGYIHLLRTFPCSEFPFLPLFLSFPPTLLQLSVYSFSF